jgi:phenylalanyl-tRNA synthetase alpha subunit
MSWQGGWMEIGGAGMVDPNVLRPSATTQRR